MCKPLTKITYLNLTGGKRKLARLAAEHFTELRILSYMVYFEFSADKTVKGLLLFRCESFNKNLTVWRFFSLIALERLKQIKIKTSPTKHKQTERFPDR